MPNLGCRSEASTDAQNLPGSGAAMLLASWKEEGGPEAAVSKDKDAKGAGEDTAPNAGAAGEALGARDKLSGVAWLEELAGREPAERKLIWGMTPTSCNTTFAQVAHNIQHMPHTTFGKMKQKEPGCRADVMCSLGTVLYRKDSTHTLQSEK